MMHLEEESQKDSAPTTKDDIPHFINKPVATIVDRMMSVKQSTLTQMFDIHDDDWDTDDPDFISRKKAKKDTVKKRGYNTPVKSWSSVSEVTEDRNSPHCVEVGDLLMSTASEISHPDYLSGKISGVYIFFWNCKELQPP